MATGGWGGAWGSQPQPQPDVELGNNNGLAAPLYGEDPGPAAKTTGAYGAFNTGPRSDDPEPNSSYQPAAGGAFSSAGTSSYPNKEAELNAREAALKKKEAELNKLEKEIVSAGGVVREKNWPIFIPMTYHNIAEEIPTSSMRVVKEVYWSWYGLVFCLLWNLFCCCVILGSDEDGKVSSWFLGVIYAMLGIPLSWILWYRKLYNGAKADSSFNFIWFFIFYAVHIGFCIWSAIAVPFSAEKWSFAGFVTAIEAFDVNIFTGVVYIMGASFWSCESLYCLWCLKDVFLFFRGQGGIEKAKQDAAISAFQQSMSRRQ